jgi:hypothetical protein
MSLCLHDVFSTFPTDLDAISIFYKHDSLRFLS